ncbi:hypothetical protein ACFQUU_02125 [Herbaspirillum sp. GCM10030257]|uniref:hypothetical protein n=1 Tax=Herbaspirillum sp. GCM10030257 TaxID=3273393 RepID=UPI00360E05C7
MSPYKPGRNREINKADAHSVRWDLGRQGLAQVTQMLTQEALQQLQRYHFDLFGEGRSERATTATLHPTGPLERRQELHGSGSRLALHRQPVARWEKWFENEGLKRLRGKPHHWCNQRLPHVRASRCYDPPTAIEIFRQKMTLLPPESTMVKLAHNRNNAVKDREVFA